VIEWNSKVPRTIDPPGIKDWSHSLTHHHETFAQDIQEKMELEDTESREFEEVKELQETKVTNYEQEVVKWKNGILLIISFYEMLHIHKQTYFSQPVDLKNTPKFQMLIQEGVLLSFSLLEKEFIARMLTERYRVLKLFDEMFNEIEILKESCPNNEQLNKGSPKTILIVLQKLFQSLVSDLKFALSITVAHMARFPYQLYCQTADFIGEHGASYEDYSFFGQLAFSGLRDAVDQELQNLITTNDLDRASFIFTLLNHMVKDFHAPIITSYAETLMQGQWHFVNAQDDSTEAKNFREAVQIVQKIFTYRNQRQNRHRFLKFYELLNLEESQVAEHLIELIPKRFISAELVDAWSITMINETIIFNSKMLSGIPTPIKIVQVMVTLLHEVSHLKKYTHLVHETPPSHRQLLNSQMFDNETQKVKVKSTGTLIEEHSFERQIPLEILNLSASEAIIKFDGESDNQWDEILSLLQESISQQERHYVIGGKKKLMIGYPSDRCGNRVVNSNENKHKELEKIYSQKKQNHLV